MESTLSIQQWVLLAHCSILCSCVFPHWHSLLKSLGNESSESVPAFAPARMVAMTLAMPPAAQPCCSNGENRLYTSRWLINCSAYFSNFINPSEENPSSMMRRISFQKIMLYIENYYCFVDYPCFFLQGKRVAKVLKKRIRFGMLPFEPAPKRNGLELQRFCTFRVSPSAVGLPARGRKGCGLQKKCVFPSRCLAKMTTFANLQPFCKRLKNNKEF